MRSMFGTLPLFSFFGTFVYLVAGVFAEYNVTVNATDTSLLYSPSTFHWNYWATEECGLSFVVKYSETKGDSVTLAFTGTAIYLNVLADIGHGSLAVVLDGVSQEVVVSSFKPIGTCRYVTAFSQFGLENELHTIQVTLDSTANAQGYYRSFALVSFRYTMNSPTETNSTIISSTVRPTEVAAFAIGSVALILAAVAIMLYVRHRRRQSITPGNAPQITPEPALSRAVLPNDTGNQFSSTGAETQKI